MRSKEEQEQIIKRALSMSSEGDGKSDVSEGRIVAVLIASEVLGADIWFALDDGWKSGDDIPVFFAGELPHLQKMNGDELRKRYEQKLALAGGWIRDKIEERIRH
jgi:hypothetical protein